MPHTNAVGCQNNSHLQSIMSGVCRQCDTILETKFHMQAIEKDNLSVFNTKLAGHFEASLSCPMVIAFREGDRNRETKLLRSALSPSFISALKKANHKYLLAQMISSAPVTSTLSGVKLIDGHIVQYE